MGAYVFMAKKTFESDKISYIFDSEQAQTSNIAEQIDQRLERAIFDGRSVLAGFNFEEKKLNSIGQKLFSEQKDIAAIEVVDFTQKETLLKLEKDGVQFPEQYSAAFGGEKLKSLDVQALGDGDFLILLSEKSSDDGIVMIKILAKFKDLIPNSPTALFLLSQEDRLLNRSKMTKTNASLNTIVKEVSLDRSSNTMLRELDGKRYLISSTALKHANLHITSVMDESVALGALKVLFDRSLIFILVSVFATVIISLFLSSGLTKSLQVLTGVAESISQGDFSSQLMVTSSDEVGVLSKAFSKMKGEIQRLLVETKDKARMEAELMTAKLVQESLFPKKAHFVSGTIEINGLFVTSTECGGDWWYYFERGNYFYVLIADATGHGTPAALITCAARALFSQIERSVATLEEMAQAWDLCVAECSNQQVMMTGILMEINKDNGAVRTINASHELPILISNKTATCDPVLLPKSPRLGEVKNVPWKTHEFQMSPGDRLVIYTDGLVSITNAEGKEIGEKRVLRSLTKVAAESASVFDLSQNFYGIFERHRGQMALPDDVTLVVLEWKKQGGELQNGMAS